MLAAGLTNGGGVLAGRDLRGGEHGRDGSVSGGPCPVPPVVKHHRVGYRGDTQGEATLNFLKMLNRAAKGAATPSRQREAATPAKPDLSMLPERFIVFDLETTGLRADFHEIIEIGAIRVNRDSDLHDTFSTLIIPTGRVSSKITSLTGLDRKLLTAEGQELASALEEFSAFVGELPLVAFNARFDHEFLNYACDRVGRAQFRNEVTCALALSRKAWPGRSNYRLTDMCADAGIKIHSEHRALPDCERALSVYVAASRKLGSSHRTTR